MTVQILQMLAYSYRILMQVLTRATVGAIHTKTLDDRVTKTSVPPVKAVGAPTRTTGTLMILMVTWALALAGTPSMVGALSQAIQAIQRGGALKKSKAARERHQTMMRVWPPSHKIDVGILRIEQRFYANDVCSFVFCTCFSFL